MIAPKGSVGRGRVIATAVIAGVLGISNPAFAQSLEAAIKATYLYKFAPFVAWSAKAFETPDSPLTVCVQGDDPFGILLDRAVADQKFSGRAIAVRRMEAADGGSGCHIVYLGGSRKQSRVEALKALRGAGVLTVTDGGPGAIRFVMKDNRVRFEIDTTEAAQGGVTLSSKLLSLAAKVRGRP